MKFQTFQIENNTEKEFERTMKTGFVKLRERIEKIKNT